MRITIETTDPFTGAGTQLPATVDSAAPAGSADAGAGPLSALPESAPSSSVDAGGPPAWLTTAINAAEASATGTFGVAPAPAPQADPNDAANAGGGPGATLGDPVY